MAAAATASSLFSESSPQSNVPAATISSSVPSVSECSHRGGFRGMFKVPSLVFDIELEDNGIGGAWQEDDWEEEEVVTEIQRFVQPTTQVEVRLLSDVRVACSHAKDGQDIPRLVSILSALGYRCSLRTALGGGDGADCLRNLRHTFIVCETPSANGAPARRYIIDAQFKEQFIIAKTTARYAAILAAIPPVFVGPEEHLSLLVNFLCTEMSAAFRQLGSVLPPWRQAASMLSKWQPRKSIDAGLGGMRHGALAGSGCVAENGMGLPTGAMSTARGSELQGFPVATDTAALATGGGGQWPSFRAAHVPLQPHNHQVLPRQQQMDTQAHPLFGGLGSAMPPAVRRPSYEPQRVVFGGNFVTITPSPATAS